MILSSDFFVFKKWHLIIAYCFIYISFTWLSNTFIFTDNYYYSVFSNNFSIDRIQNLIKFSRKIEWLIYAVMPLILFFKWLILTSVIYIGLTLFEQKISFQNCFKIVLISELAIAISGLVRIVLLLFHKPETLKAIQFFYPLSITQLINLEKIPDYLVYPLEQCNLFEVAYWFLIVSGIQTLTQKSFKQSLKITTCSYGLALFVWILCIVFIQLQVS
jgi:hypothetical protein